MTTKATEDHQIVPPAENILAVDHVSSILQNSIQNIESTNKEHDVSKTIYEAIDLLHNLKNQASSFCLDQSTNDVPDQNDVNVCEKNIAINHTKNSGRDNSPESAPLQLLACAAISAVDSLDDLVQNVNQSRKRARTSSSGKTKTSSVRTSSGYAWKALESVVSSTFQADSSKFLDENDAGASKSKEISRALASLAVGLVLSIDSTDTSTTRMVASAVLPSDQMHASKPGKKRKKKKVSKKMTSDDRNSEDAVKTQRIIHSMARDVVVGLLCLAVDTTNQSAQDKESEQPKKHSSVDLQIVSKLESGFSVGDLGRKLNIRKEDKELAKAVANVVDCVLVRSSTSDDAMDDYGNCDGGEVISNDSVAPTFSLVANTRPWDYVQVEKLVRCAAEMDLWYSAELLCDAAIASSSPQGAETEALLTDSLVTSPPQDSIGHLAAGAIIDITFDYRQYRRADGFASKYYSFGGPERYAEARFLHACDTITKVLKRKQVQIIDKQIDRVDVMVARVSKDLISTSNNDGGQRQFHGEDIAIETMSENIRQFTLRRLRATNLHAAAARSAKLWGMQYDHDPMHMAQELEERKRLYIQWNDEGCPGNSSGSKEALPVPELISEPAELLKQFCVLENHVDRTVGFDCEWHDSINYVALLQLSTITVSLLLDIPALTATKEGCDALRTTVGKLFSRSTDVKHVIGFGCKDDIKRLRACPCVTAAHWFPQNEKCTFEDLRVLIPEVTPQIGGKGGLKYFGLSRACEVFLGKQLDKAEQCSDWLARPLSPEQLEYAALDAWSCAAILAKILKGGEQVVTEKKD
eukprot:CAMPEP_0202006722 /NCGR_PEP_ID=MMETSP0905-20130828/11378_1 /ASSEMBLY_ACC=CAM_ASM_000554 /TAXON_ID=420261 /ORGANISM="Thalassiosira antarctica, Strain CCMP982" /LENGTH=808 /DNA_ID=CAMNT_0048564521 /DNA_START=179 /DNA_END=2605 /DNA_ORIENTATION=+